MSIKFTKADFIKSVKEAMNRQRKPGNALDELREIVRLKKGQGRILPGTAEEPVEQR